MKQEIQVKQQFILSENIVRPSEKKWKEGDRKKRMNQHPWNPRKPEV
uniref:Uncharacterized protein n=1 Tax=Rhizophora mucronata TaxID=61149 RepID=A0A2P2IR26_RHIMU